MDSSEEGEIKFRDSTDISKIRFTYKISEKIGQGTFGDVYAGYQNNKKLALKKIEIASPSGISITILREITLLKSLNHKNIVKLLDVSIDMNHKKKFDRNDVRVYLVFPFYKHNLLNLNLKKKLSHENKVSIGKQILLGLQYLHKKSIFHRDLKSENILLNEKYDVVIADFGLAKRIPNYGNLTPGIVTLWYRAPELILGDCNYSESIDMWSFGCILGEMYNNKPILPGESEIEQLNLIVNLCGTISEQTLPKANKLPLFKNVKLPQGPNRLEYFCKDVEEKLICILPKILNLNPDKRLTAERALMSSFFRSKDSKKW